MPGPSYLVAGFDDLRLLGNEAAHIESTVYDKVGRAKVEIGIEVAKEVLKGVYQMSELLGRLRNLQARQTPVGCSVTVDDQYHVITPLEEAWVDSPKEVRAVIARYMATDLSSLARVTVIRLPRGEGAQTGQPLSAADFWPPP